MSIVGARASTVAIADTVAPGSSKASEINAKIARLATDATDNVKRTLYLERGSFYLEEPIVHANNVILRGDPSGSVLVPTYGEDADDDEPDNHVVGIQGEIDDSTLDTTMSADATKGSTSIAVVSAGSITAGDYILITGGSTGNQSYANDLGHADGTSIELQEIIRVSDDYAGGTTITLAWPLQQSHTEDETEAMPRVRAVTPVRGAEIHDVTILGSEDDVTTASGVRVLYALDTKIVGLKVGGTSRACIDAQASKDIYCSWFRSLGTNNAWFFCESVINGDFSNFRGTDGAPRSHTLGVPRAQSFSRYRCTAVTFRDGTFENGTWGIFHGGGVHMRFVSIHVRNMEITQEAYDRYVASGEINDGGFHGLAYGSGGGPIVAPHSYSEMAFGTVISDLSCEDLRAPSTSAWTNTPYRACAVYIHDTRRVTCSNLSIINAGRGDSNVAGLRFSDCEAQLSNVEVRGHSFAITTENVEDDVKIKNLRLDATRGNSPNAAFAFYLNHTSASGSNGLQIDGCQIVNFFSAILRTGNQFEFDGTMTIRDMWIDSDRWEFCKLAYNATATVFLTGDVVEIDSANSSSDRRIVTPDTGGTDYAGRLAAVVTGSTKDPGTGYMLVAPLPQNWATVTASTAAVAYGDRIGYTGTRRAAKSEGEAQPIGKALSRKAAGSEGFIVLGSAA